MKKSVKLGALAATALLAACATGSGAKGPDVTADQNDTGYVTSRDGGVVTGKFGECFHDKAFKASHAIVASPAAAAASPAAACCTSTHQ